jgi:chromosome transmission fidelity protein 1
MVVFFPSYGYEETVSARWEASGLLRRLAAAKPVFREPRAAADLDGVLRRYAQQVAHDPARGALLLSVVGGKMSEGINFKDALGRCVVMVGLPYANRDGPDLREKLLHLDRGDPRRPPRAGDEHYLHLCMKAVNQSVGRAIRHAGDYAAILLVDGRYGDARHWQALPAWLRPRPPATAADATVPAARVPAAHATFFSRFPAPAPARAAP